MGVLDKFERGLERAVKAPFARVFKAEVQPVEIASSIRDAMDEQAAVVGPGRTLVHNVYIIELAATDFDRLASYDTALTDELVAAAEDHADAQRYTPAGVMEVRLVADDELETGIFRVRSKSSDSRQKTRVGAPSAAPRSGGPSQPPRAGGPPQPGYDPSAYRGPDREGRPSGGGQYPGSGQQQAAPGSSRPAAGPYQAPPRPQQSSPAFAPPGGQAAAASPAGPGAAPGYGSPIRSGQAPPGVGAAAAIAARGATRPQPTSQPEQGTEPRRGAPRQPWLEINGQRHPLTSAVTTIGRDEAADIVLDDPGASRRHAELRLSSDGPHSRVVLRDLGSTNGTYLNGDQVGNEELKNGDRLTMGRTTLTFHLEGSR